MGISDTVKSKKLDLVEIINIQENKYLILNQINSVDINYNSKVFIVTDIINRTINMYDYFSGNIIKFLKANTDLTDSVAFSNRIPCNNPHMFKTDNEKFKNINIRYLKYYEYEHYGLTLNAIKLLQNQFCVAKFIDKKNIYILTLIYVCSLADNSIKGFDNTSAITILDNNLKIQRVIIFENFLYAYAGPWNFLYFPSEKEYIVNSCNNTRESWENKHDSLVALASYNENGDFIKINSYLSDKYVDNLLGFDTRDWKPSLIQINNLNFVAYPVDLSLYGLDNKFKFKLYNLPYTNDSGFKLVKQLKIKNHFEDLNNTPNILLNLFPIEITNLINANGNLLIQLAVYDTTVTGKYYFILQEYNTSGILLSQTNLFNEPNNKIQFITFDNFNNYLVIFKKSKKGWTMEKRKWE